MMEPMVKVGDGRTFGSVSVGGRGSEVEDPNGKREQLMRIRTIKARE